jgi:hypothetical protein
MPWYGDFVTDVTSAADWNKIMNDNYVITLEDMPGWSNYNPSSSSGNATPSSSSSAPPTPIINSQLSIINYQLITYYSLKGEPLGNAKPQKAGVYIVKQGYSIKKIVVK